MIEEDEDPVFEPESILERKGNKYLIRWKGMDETLDVWLSKSMTHRGSVIHKLMTEKDSEEDNLKAVAAIDKATSRVRAQGPARGGGGGVGRPQRSTPSVYRRGEGE